MTIYIFQYNSKNIFYMEKLRGNGKKIEKYIRNTLPTSDMLTQDKWKELQRKKKVNIGDYNFEICELKNIKDYKIEIKDDLDIYNHKEYKLKPIDLSEVCVN